MSRKLNIFVVLSILLVLGTLSIAFSRSEVISRKADYLNSNLENEQQLNKQDSIDSLTGFYPNAENLLLTLIEPRCYHEDEVDTASNNELWIGLFKKKDNYFIDTVRISIVTSNDEVLGETEDDTLSWTARCVESLSPDSCLLLIKGLPSTGMRQLTSFNDTKQALYPFEPISISYSDKVYTLFAEADTLLDDYDKVEQVCTNYRLYLKGSKGEHEIIQELVTVPIFYFNMVTLLFVTDIDNDGYPDFLLNISEHYNAYQPTLYLSSLADKDKLVQVAASHRSVGC